MARLALHLLGQFHATLDGQVVTTFKTDKVRALLAYLIVEKERAHRREALASLLWPEGPTDAVRANLRQSLCRLRDTLQDQDQAHPWLLATPETVQFDPASDYWVDALEFERLLATCETHRHRSLDTCQVCAGRMAQAVALYRGDFLAGLCIKDSPGFAEWSLIHQQRVHHKAMNALQHLAVHHLQWGDTQAAEAYLRRQLALEPWSEPAHQQLMRLYAASGRRGEAVAQYLYCCRALAEHLGVGPERATLSLFESIRAGHSFTLPTNRLLNAPASHTGLIGRAYELAQIGETLQDPECRLLTLVGLGGCGKTSLALAVAAREAHAFRDGACFCSLAPDGATESPAPALAQALGIAYSSVQDAPGQVVHYLHHKEMLLVLDNLDHLPAAHWLAHLLHTAPGVVILATAQHALGVRAEWRIEVRGLDYPKSGSAIAWSDIMRFPAVQLFIQRAGQVRAGFALTEQTAPDVVRICRQVEGLPLALQLAAAWSNIMTCAEIADAIERSLDFLEAPWVDIPRRQRGLRATFDYSWSLLNQEEQDAFGCLSLFRGEFSHAAARAVVGSPCATRCRQDAFDERPIPSAGCLFRAFLEKSLLQEVTPGRYRLHSLLRQYAAEKLTQREAEQTAARARFVRYCARLAAHAHTAWGGSQEEYWRSRLYRDWHNLEDALAWSLADPAAEPDTAVRLADTLAYYRQPPG